MKKLLVGILMVFLLSLAAASAVTDSLSWNTVAPMLPTVLVMQKNIAMDLSDTLSQYITQTDTLDSTLVFADNQSANIDVDIDMVTHVATLTPAPDFTTDIGETISFYVSDSDDLNVLSGDILITVVNDGPSFTSLPITDATEDSVYTYDVTAEDINGDSLAFDPTALPLPSWLTLTDNGDGTATLTGIPLDGHVGDNEVVFMVTDGDLITRQPFTITVENTAPVWDISTMDTTVIEDIGDSWFLDVYVDDLSLITVKNVDSDLTLNEDYTWDDLTNEFTLTTSVETGVYAVTFTADDGEFLVDVKIDFTVLPEKCSCEIGPTGDIDITDVDVEDDDELQPGKKVDLTVDVENRYDDELDVTVEVYLYDLTRGKKLLDLEDEMEIDSEDEESFEFELELPVEDLDPSHKYALFIKAYEDEDDHCDQQTEEIEINLEDHKLLIESFTLDKSTVNPGDLVEATIKVRNIGEEDEDVVITLKEGDLGLDKSSEEFEVEEYDDGDNDDSVSTQVIRFTVPADAKDGSYSIEAVVEYDDGDEREGGEFAPLKVSVPGDEIKVKVGSLPELKEGQTYSLSVEITNDGDSVVGYIVSIEGDWLESVPQIVTLDAGETKTVNFNVEPTEDGAQTGKVVIKDDSEVIKTKDFLADVKAGGLSGITGGFAGAFKDSSAFWIIGDIVLVIVAIFFLKLIFSSGRKHQPVEEIKL